MNTMDALEALSERVAQAPGVAAVLSLRSLTGDNITDDTQLAQRYRELDSILDDLGVRDVDLSPIPELVETLVQMGSDQPVDELAGGFSVPFRSDQPSPDREVEHELSQLRNRVRRLADPVEVLQQPRRVHRSNACDRIAFN